MKRDEISYFFCYDRNLSNYLKRKFNHITTAMNPSTKKIFTLFVRTDELSKAINQYQK